MQQVPILAYYVQSIDITNFNSIVSLDHVLATHKRSSMHRNWKVISRETNASLRFLLATTVDERILGGLEKGFPEFFASEEQPLCVPLSIIREWCEEGDRDAPLMEIALEHFGIPHFCFGDGPGVDYPQEWEKTLGTETFAINEPQHNVNEKVYGDLLFLEWQGQRCIVADWTDQGDMLILVPEQFIDINA